MQTALAWKNLTHDRRRLATALAGIGFAVLLMFMQTGFRYALFDSTVEVVRDLDADILVASRAKYSLTTNCPFKRSRIYQARSCEGVQGVHPLYIEPFYAVWKLPGQKGHPIRVLACDPADPIFLFPEVRQHAQQLRGQGAALVDIKCKPNYRIPQSDEALKALDGAELSNRAIRPVGRFSMGTDFANDGNLIVSSANFARYFPHRVRGGDPLSRVDLGVVKVGEGEDPLVVRDRLDALLPGDVEVYTKEEFVHREIKFWADSTPIGYIFTIGTIMGFVVGVIICYQIIYSDIADHLAEFATLKAMGYRNRYFIGVVLCQSLYLSVLGFLPGLLVSRLVYWRLSESTGLLMMLTVRRTADVFLMTAVMCILSGCLAMRKVLSTDPAELF